MRVTSRLALLAVVLLALACGRGSMGPSGMGRPAALAVIEGSCHPTPTTPCSATVSVQVTDAAGHMLTGPDFSFSWSGCASGTGREATCVIDRLVDLDATVEVRDNRGFSGRATGRARGVNRPPAPTFRDFIGQSASGNGFTLFAQSNDPDPFDSFGPYNCAGRREGVAVGDCRFSATMCGAQTGGEIDLDVVKTASAGMCTVTLTITDEWGASGSVTKTFSYPR